MRTSGKLKIMNRPVGDSDHKESPERLPSARVSADVRELPPPTPTGFHDSLRAGDTVDFLNLGGWWRVGVKAGRADARVPAAIAGAAVQRAVGQESHNRK